ncbi:hypothetical protein R1flu_010068 [Riccia fluitans]|uniref:Secreted protein n=1 Tax=Riccia fluitans TaxID=41844 RepID=A0ABD1Z4A2_9MARC
MLGAWRWRFFTSFVATVRLQREAMPVHGCNALKRKTDGRESPIQSKSLITEFTNHKWCGDAIYIKPVDCEFEPSFRT